MWPTRNASTVSVINTTTGAVDKTLTVGSQPSAVAVSPATTGQPTAGLAYVTNRASGTVSVINTDQQHRGGLGDPGGGPRRRMWRWPTTPRSAGSMVVNSGSNNVSVIDARNITTTSPRSGWARCSAPTAVARQR